MSVSLDRTHIASRIVLTVLIALFGTIGANASVPKCSSKDYLGPTCSLGGGAFKSLGYGAYNVRCGVSVGLGIGIWPHCTGDYADSDPCGTASAQARNDALRACFDSYPQADCQIVRELPDYLSGSDGTSDCRVTAYAQAFRHRR